MFVEIAIFLDFHTFPLPLYWRKPFGIGKVPSHRGALLSNMFCSARRLACKDEESDDGGGRVFTVAEDDVTIRVWGANNVSASNCIWSQNRRN